MNKKTVVLVNHQPIMLEGLLRIFGGSDNFTLIESSILCSRAVDLATIHTPDIILLDADDVDQMIAATVQIMQGRKKTKVVIFTSTLNVETAVRALDAGAKGYIASTSTAGEVLAATRMVAEGDTFISPNVATKVIGALRIAARRKALNTAKRLNVREEQIVELLLKGKTNKEIAFALGLQEKTVKHYMTLLMHKLDARNRLELALTLRVPENAAANVQLFN
ncbi:response regulator transcription factor [Paraburkholderia aspalathi]|nr:response regulator transcription factor [Paraburkholderia aspalathi]